jgi:hypothetical protein
MPLGRVGGDGLNLNLNAWLTTPGELQVQSAGRLKITVQAGLAARLATPAAPAHLLLHAAQQLCGKSLQPAAITERPARAGRRPAVDASWRLRLIHGRGRSGGGGEVVAKRRHRFKWQRREREAHAPNEEAQWAGRRDPGCRPVCGNVPVSCVLCCVGRGCRLQAWVVGLCGHGGLGHLHTAQPGGGPAARGSAPCTMSFLRTQGMCGVCDREESCAGRTLEGRQVLREHWLCDHRVGSPEHVEEQVQVVWRALVLQSECQRQAGLGRLCTALSGPQVRRDEAPDLQRHHKAPREPFPQGP